MRSSKLTSDQTDGISLMKQFETLRRLVVSSLFRLLMKAYVPPYFWSSSSKKVSISLDFLHPDFFLWVWEECELWSCELRVASCELRVASCELRVASCELRVASCELRVASCELRVASCELRVASCELRVTSCKLQLRVAVASCSCELLVASGELPVAMENSVDSSSVFSKL